MELINILAILLIPPAMLVISYQLGYRSGRRHSDEILGRTVRSGLKRIKAQADRNQ